MSRETPRLKPASEIYPDLANEGLASANRTPWWEELLPGEAAASTTAPATPPPSATQKARTPADAIPLASPAPAAAQGLLAEVKATSTPPGGGIGPVEGSASKPAPFAPRPPKSLAEAGLHSHEVERLILKFLANQGVASGKDISAQVRLPFNVVMEILAHLKHERLIVYLDSFSTGDYVCGLTDQGVEAGRRFLRMSSYYGSAPVTLGDYLKSVRAQRGANQAVRASDLKRAFGELALSDALLSQIGQAIHAGVGLFLFGPPGNGKTSIAMRITESFGDSIWIPRCLTVGGELVRIYDPNRHEVLDENERENDGFDRRWVRIRRPTVIAGGDLTMDDLELRYCEQTGVNEAPLQMKSNCGTLVIDDFGRQPMSPDKLLNRWIVPLENRHDFLTLPSGRKIQVPFEQLLVLSTNLEPRDLVDEAFLRRIPYKVQVISPEEAEFRELFRSSLSLFGLGCSSDVLDYLIERHYRAESRSMRFCHVRDLMRQVHHYCGFHQLPMEITRENIDIAVENYFSVL